MESEKTLALYVQLHEAEKIRKYLLNNDLIRRDLKVKKDNEYIYFPIKSKPKEFDSNKIIKFEFEKRNEKPATYKDFLEIPNHLKDKLPTSYDVIGNIIMLKLSEDLLFYKELIGVALLKSNKNIKTVCISDPVAGELRIRNLKVIAGEKNTKTIHKEYGLFFEVDVKKTYFSPRLANERRRITDLVKPGETIVDMFSGVAPFSVMIAKYSNPKIVYAIDKNDHAIRFAKENIKLNNVLNKVEVVHSDAKKTPIYLKNCADRIIMNLPFSAHKFFNYAIKISKSKSIVHYYDVLKDVDIDHRIEELKEIALVNEFQLTNLNIRKIKTYAPREFYIVIDITAKKMPT